MHESFYGVSRLKVAEDFLTVDKTGVPIATFFFFLISS